MNPSPIQVRGLRVFTKRFILQPRLTMRSDFEPVAELHEVSHEYDAGRQELLILLSSGLEDALGAHWDEDQERGALKIRAIVDGFMNDIFRKTQRQAGAGPSYSRSRRGAGGSTDGVVEASSHSRGFPRPQSAANIPRTPSTLSTSTTSGPRNLRPLPPLTPAQSNRSASPAVSVRQIHNTSMSRVTSPTSNRSSSRRSMAGDSNGTQARYPHQQRPLAEQTISVGPSAALFNEGIPEETMGNGQSSALGGAIFPIPERAVTHHRDAVSQAPALRNFPQSPGLDTHQLQTNVAGFQGYNSHPSLDFDLPGIGPASPSSPPWSSLGPEFDTSGSRPGPAPPGMTEAQLDYYVRSMAESSRAELERGPGDSSLNEVVMGGRQEHWTRPTGQERRNEQPRHGAQRESPVAQYCTDSDGRVRHHSDCPVADSPTLTVLCYRALS